MKRWTVALAGLMTVLGPGALYSFSLISTPLSAAFGWSAASVAWAFALANAFLAVGGFVGGLASDRFGSRPVAVTGVILWGGGFAACSTLAQTHSLLALYLFYGVFGGLGCGMAYISVLSSVLKWFPRRRGFSGGFVIMGFGLGSVLYTAVVRSTQTFASITSEAQGYITAQATAVDKHMPFDVARYSMLQTDTQHFMSILLISGIAFAVIGSIAAFFVTLPPATTSSQESSLEPAFTLRATLGDARFYVLWTMLFLNIFGGVTIISNMVPIMHELTGITTTDAAALYVYLAIFNGIGRVLWGWVSDRYGRRLAFATVLGGQSIAFFVLDGTKDPIFVVAAIATLLLCYGGGFGIMPAFNADLFGNKHFGANYGAQLSAWGLAAILGVYLNGIIKSLSGSSAGLMQPVSIMLLVAMLLPLLIEVPKSPAATDARPIAA